MKTVCAWCGKILKDGAPLPVSHGICDKCLEVEMNRSEDSPGADGSDHTEHHSPRHGARRLKDGKGAGCCAIEIL